MFGPTLALQVAEAPERALRDQRDPETGVPNPHVGAALGRFLGDRHVLERWREVGYQAAAVEACDAYGHLRARGGLCERCGRGIGRRAQDHLERDLALAAARTSGADPRLLPRGR